MFSLSTLFHANHTQLAGRGLQSHPFTLDRNGFPKSACLHGIKRRELLRESVQIHHPPVIVDLVCLHFCLDIKSTLWMRTVMRYQSWNECGYDLITINLISIHNDVLLPGQKLP